jgi:glucose-6-phosphate 1-dehydrogenase
MLKLEPAILTIFGITGDLANRKLLPALYHLAHDELLPKSFRIVGITRRGTTAKAVVERIRASVELQGDKCSQEILDWLEQATSVVTMDITDPGEYVRLKLELDRLENESGVCLNRLFYLAIPSQVFSPVVRELGRSELNSGCQHGRAESRLLIEKPFGYDLVSAEELITETTNSFAEDQIYRIDHYLAKETVQNILKFRFDNPLFSGSWDNSHISHILVTASESIGIEGRVAFYEQMGALRDIIQSHLLQLIALVTMDKPTSFSADDIHGAKEKLLSQIHPPKDNEMIDHAIRGQYATYRKEVAHERSQTETYTAVRFEIDNDRWRGVPVLVRTGKAMKEKVTEITVVFRDPGNKDCTNFLTIRIQPHEGIVLDLRIKKPGFDDDVEHVQMDFCYSEKLNVMHPDAYERVLVDTMRGDKTLFATSQEVLASWHITEPILHAWQHGLSPLHHYTNGSWGPEAGNKLAVQAGQPWMTSALNICSIHTKKSR